MDIVKKINEIEEHFSSVSSEEFEKALIRSGHGKIEFLADSDMTFADMEEEN